MYIGIIFIPPQSSMVSQQMKGSIKQLWGAPDDAQFKEENPANHCFQADFKDSSVQ